MGHPAQVPTAEPRSQPQAPRFQQLPCTPGLAEQAPSGPEPLAKNQEGDKQPSQHFGPLTTPALGGETESWAQLKARATFPALIPQEGGRLLGGKLLEHAKLQGSVGITTHSTEVHKKQNQCVVQPGHLEPHRPIPERPKTSLFGGLAGRLEETEQSLAFYSTVRALDRGLPPHPTQACCSLQGPQTRQRPCSRPPDSPALPPQQPPANPAGLNFL